MTVFDAEVEIILLKNVEEQADKAAAALRQVVGLLREVRDLGGALKTVRSDGKLKTRKRNEKDIKEGQGGNDAAGR